MRRAVQVVTAGSAGLCIFQVALAAGAPLGDAAWGGVHARLTGGERVGSAISALFYVLAIVVIRRRAAGREERRYRWGTWALVVIFTSATLTNLASSSAWENYLMAPLALLLATLCLAVALRAPGAKHPHVKRMLHVRT